MPVDRAALKLAFQSLLICNNCANGSIHGGVKLIMFLLKVNDATGRKFALSDVSYKMECSFNKQ